MSRKRTGIDSDAPGEDTRSVLAGVSSYVGLQVCGYAGHHKITA
ncbi:hypothetical protein [Corynebacterium glyciniphilum]|nr:hypothetical protein [Corynebacterium glyciniphilum]